MTLLHSTTLARPTATAHPRFSVTTLARDQYPEWNALVTRSPHGTVFHYSWYLDAVSQQYQILGCWSAENGKLVAGIPLPQRKRAGLVLYHSPLLTPYLGPIFDLAGNDSMSEQLSMMRHCGELLANAIQGFDCFYYIAGAAAPDLQGFVWAGFQIELAYTFRFDAGMTPDTAYEQITRTHRQKLRKNAQYRIEAGDDVRALATLSHQTFERQGITCPFSESSLRRLWDVVSGQARAVLYTARNLHGRPVSSLLVVHDDRTSYQIASGVDTAARDSTAGYLLTWRAICDALNAGRAFDFEGSGIRGVEKYYRRWGAPPRSVWQLKKDGSIRGWVSRVALYEFKAANAGVASRTGGGTIARAENVPGPAKLDSPEPVEALPLRIGRSILRWASPNVREENFSWRHLASCERVLDVACGIGSFIARNPSKAMGIDISERNVSMCRARGLDVIRGNALALPFEDGSFDGVHSAQVMFAFNAREALQYMNELVRVTRPGRTISISTLSNVEEVFEHPEVVRPYPPQAIFRMISTPQTDCGTQVPGLTFKAIQFRRPPLINFRSDGSPWMWRAGSLINALQYGCYLRKFWKYSGYTMILKKLQNPPSRFSSRS
jgi:SAM-dependent methyltransferase